VRWQGVDFDPQVVRAWNAQGRVAVYGDAEDPEFAAALPLSQARWVVSSIRDPHINRAIYQALHGAGYRGYVAFSADSREQGEAWVSEGRADLVLVPFEDAAEQAVDLLTTTEQQIVRRAMERRINQMSGHYIICGFGRMGQQIVRDLERQGVPHVVVENNPEQIPRLQARGVPYVEGKASEDEVLLRAGVERAKGLIAVAASDEENVFIVLTARGLNPNLMIIARSILEANEDKLRRAGADRVISPYILGGRRMAAEVTRRGVVDFLDLILHGDTHNVDIVHLVVPPGSPLVGRTLAELGVWQRCGVTVLATQLPSGEMTANPCPETRLADAMELIVMGNPEQVARARALLEGSAEGVAAAPSDQS
jgi:voltage-gated potassium channel